jgi:hypothetical protein
VKPLRTLGADSVQSYAFEEIPASSSGITWVHAAGKSPQKYLPETSGAGCAFLDYDNDGWMNIYLVNSGKCDFYNPPPGLRNALYHNNRDGTFSDVTEKAGVSGGGYGMGVVKFLLHRAQRCHRCHLSSGELPSPTSTTMDGST